MPRVEARKVAVLKHPLPEPGLKGRTMAPDAQPSASAGEKRSAATAATVALAGDNSKHDRRMYGSRFSPRIPDIDAPSTDEARRRSRSAQARVSVYRQVGFGAAAALLSARGFA